MIHNKYLKDISIIKIEIQILQHTKKNRLPHQFIKHLHL